MSGPCVQRPVQRRGRGQGSPDPSPPASSGPSPSSVPQLRSCRPGAQPLQAPPNHAPPGHALPSRPRPPGPTKSLGPAPAATKTRSSGPSLPCPAPRTMPRLLQATPQFPCPSLPRTHPFSYQVLSPSRLCLPATPRSPSLSQLSWAIKPHPTQIPSQALPLQLPCPSPCQAPPPQRPGPKAQLSLPRLRIFQSTRPLWTLLISCPTP